MQSILHEPERVFFESVISEAIAPEAIGRVQYQFPVTLCGRNRKIDFALLGETKKIALELDGFRYHAEGQISQSDFSDQLERQNSLILENWTVLRFSWLDVSTRPEYCVNVIRRSLVDDVSLHPILAAESVRPHLVQSEALNALAEIRDKGAKRGLVVLPTGLGKTYLAAFDAAKFSGRTLFIVHNNEILHQASSTFQRVMANRTVGLFHGHEKAPTSDVVCGNVYSLHSRNLQQFFSPKDFEYIIIDESHHAAAKSYRELLGYFKPAFTLGLTATPVRTDQQDIVSLLDKNVVYSLDTATAIERGLLVPFNYTAFCDDIDYSKIHHNGFRYDVKDLNRALIIEKRDEAIFEHYTASGMHKAIGFCVSIEHADRMADYFRQRGVAAVSIHSRLLKDVRTKAISDFRANTVQVVFVRDIFNEGVDFPDVRTLMFLRPTESRLIFMQQLGRGLRLSSMKHEVKVLDFIGNYRGAEHVYSYLAEVGSPDQQVAAQKPVYLFDNGCSVTFTEKAVEAIAAVGISVKTDIDIVKKVFSWAGRKSKLPSFCDFLEMTDFRIADVYSVYGCWNQLIARLRMIDDSWNYSDMQLPEVVSGLTLDEIGEFLDGDRGLVENAVMSIRDLCPQFHVCMAILTTPPKKQARGGVDIAPICEAIERIAKDSREILDAMRVAVFVLSFKHSVSRLKIPPFDGAVVAGRNLEAATHFRDTVRVGVESSECLAWLTALMRFDSPHREIDSEYFNYLLAGHRILSDIQSSYHEIVSGW